MRTAPIFALLLLACSGAPVPADPPERVWQCQIESGTSPPFAELLGCVDDWDALSSEPLDASIPGARSTKTVIDRHDDDHLYFQDSQTYGIHWEFASAHLSGNGLPFVPDLGQFNLTEYYSPDRRFILGAVTHYEEPDVWAYEIAPYDAASAEMVHAAFDAIRQATWFGDALRFHPTSTAVASMADQLPEDVPTITTDELFDGTTYQPLNLGTAVGQLSFRTSTEVDGGYVNPREIVVLDAIPNDISIVAAIVTAAFQTPLSHINVLSQNRGTPNMGLSGAWDDPTLRALDGAWVELTVGPFAWEAREVSLEEAEAWWDEHRPEPLTTPPMDVSVVGLVDDIHLLDASADLGDELDVAIPRFGGKASHYGALADDPAIPNPPAFVIPVSAYDDHMHAHGLWEQVEALHADPVFQGDTLARAAMLADLQDAILDAPIDPALLATVEAKVVEDFGGIRMRFRSSTTAEDLGAFSGAGLYTSKAGTPGDPEEPVDLAIKTVWASVWGVRAWEERDYYGIDHRQVGMAILSHRSFPREEANGVAITANIFDSTGLNPAFYVNVQLGGESVVQPEAGIVSDQFLYFHTLPGQPTQYLASSNLVPPGSTVLSTAQVHELGEALHAVHTRFLGVYGTSGFYAMDTEFKFDDDELGEPTLYLKQARPYPGRGQ